MTNPPLAPIDRRRRSPAMGRRARVAAGLSLALLAAPPAVGQRQAPLGVDATGAPPVPRSDHLRMGTQAGPNGVIAVNSRYLTRDGRPFLPVMGEFHFSRYPAAEWEGELLKMKAAGVTVVASYVLWNHHELAPGEISWTGDRDVRRFVQLCAKHGLLFFLRPGPWAHAEARFGGIPDWVVARGRVRSNDLAYMADVGRFWTSLRDQLRGLLWKDGGPVIGLQVENEYNLSGPGQGRDHVAALKSLARDLGLDVPLYTVTGWDRTIYPRGEVLPVMGGYPDEPWSASRDRLPPKENYVFRFDSRVSGNLGAQTAGRGVGDAEGDAADTPFLGAEYGGGVPVMYRRRPLLEPADVGAAVTAQLGSGVNLLGYYMFHGGANPQASGRGLEETQRSGGYNDVPTIGYDFQAPIGQYGEVGRVSGALRPLHYLLAEYGSRLATMAVHRPDRVPDGPADLSTPRWSVRSAGDAGFVFLNNHVRQHPMVVQRDVRFEVRLPGGALTFPTAGVTVPSGASFAWPFNLDLDGVRLAWATAQLVTRLADAQGPIHVLAASLDGPVELAFAPGTGTLSVPSRRDAAGRLVARVTPDARRPLWVTAADGQRVRLLVLDRASLPRTWVGDAFGRRVMVLTDADVTFADGGVQLRQRGERRFRFALWPRIAALRAGAPLRNDRGAYAADVAGPASRSLVARRTRDAGEAPPVEVGGPARAAMQPLPEAHRAAAAWSFRVPADALDAGDAFLELDWRGDVGRLFDGTAMLDDAFWDGRSWRVGLRRFRPRLGHDWQLTVLPLRRDAPIYLDDRVRSGLPDTPQVAELRGVRLIPEHRLTLEAR